MADPDDSWRKAHERSRQGRLTTTTPNSLEIANAATLRPISEVAAELGIDEAQLEHYGTGVAKIDLAALDVPSTSAGGGAKDVVVTAVTPSPLGEGKTTTCVGLAQGLVARGAKTGVTQRQPSMGPTFGIKGGGDFEERDDVVEVLEVVGGVDALHFSLTVMVT